MYEDEDENEDDLREGPTVVLRSVQVDDAYGIVQHPISKFTVEGYIKRDVLSTLGLLQNLSDIVDADDKRRAVAQADAMAGRMMSGGVAPCVAPSTDALDDPLVSPATPRNPWGPNDPTSASGLNDPPRNELVARVAAALLTAGVHGVRVEPLKLPGLSRVLRTVVCCTGDLPGDPARLVEVDDGLTAHYAPGIGLLVGVLGGCLQDSDPKEVRHEATLCATHLIETLPHWDVITALCWIVSLCPDQST